MKQKANSRSRTTTNNDDDCVAISCFVVCCRRFFPFWVGTSSFLKMKVDSSSIAFLQNNGQKIDFRAPEETDEDPCSTECSAIKFDIEREIQRLQSLRSYHVLGLDYQDCHRRFASLAARYFHAPLAKIVLVDMERCWSLACTGDLNETRDTARWGSIYDKAVMDPAMFYCVKDMESDMRHQKIRNASGLEDYRFFASTPLLSRDGQHIGVLAVMDFEPRPMPSVEDVLFLKDVASSLMELLEQKRCTLLKGVNQSSAGLLRSARFVRDCVKVVHDDEELQIILGVQQKEMVQAAATNAEFMCGEFSSPSVDQKQASNQKFVKERLCGGCKSNKKASYC